MRYKIRYKTIRINKKSVAYLQKTKAALYQQYRALSLDKAQNVCSFHKIAQTAT